MVKDFTIIATARINYELLCSAKTLFDLACVLPLLKVVQGLSKFAQGCHTFICNFVATFKLCESNLLKMIPRFPLSILAFSLSYLSTSMISCA
jgi:hypothetical protein